MTTYPLIQVDAFTDCPLGGNPCAVLFDTEDLTDDEMLSIAREMNLSETAFIRKTAKGNYAARYFTPAEEIPFAGHPTIATVSALIDSQRIALVGDYSTITLEVKIGSIQVEIYATRGVVKQITMTQHKPEFLSMMDPQDVIAVFGLELAHLIPNVPIQVVSTGTPQLMVPLRDLAALARINLDIPAYFKLRAAAHFFSPHLFCLQGATPAGNTFARHFGVPPDTPEDPFTGSATGGMAAYLWRYGLIDSPRFIAEQGHWMHRPGQAQVEIIGSREDIQAVKVGGNAVVVLRGELVI